MEMNWRMDWESTEGIKISTSFFFFFFLFFQAGAGFQKALSSSWALFVVDHR